MTRIRLAALAVALLVVPSGPLLAQSADKRPLEIADYQMWRSIDNEEISGDGAWVAWSYSRVRGDDTLQIRSVDGPTRYAVPRARNGRFSADAAWVAYTVVHPGLRPLGARP